MSRLRRIATIAVAALMAGLLVPLSVASEPEPAAALSGSEFDPGYIISDEKFFDSDSMTFEQIQAFLENVSVACAPGFYCADTVVMPRATTPRAPDRYCDGYASRQNETVAKIVYKVAESCGINPQVLLVKLQKEQGLFRFATRSADAMTTTYTYRAAMGYGCPDTAACEALYLGFDNQVYLAARQLQVYTQNPGWWSYRVGANSIGYHPDSIYRSPPRCGKQNVSIRNQATANLYIYTPYVPNASALSNLRGTGDTCASYGNRNFWVFFNDWFGSPTGSDPQGNIETVSVKPGVVSVVGWALDRDDPSPVDVRVHVDGEQKIVVRADLDRPDVGNAFPGMGPRHGFAMDLRLSNVSREFCLYAVNRGAGADALLGCREVNPMSGPPIGNAERIEQRSSGVVVEGWALDPDSSDAATVDVLVDGRIEASAVTNIIRPDVRARYGAYVAERGFSITLPSVPRGSREICVRVRNVGFGSSTTLRCATIRVLDSNPEGSLETAFAVPGGIEARGWAIDRESTLPIRTHFYVDGIFVSEVKAELERRDVGRLFPRLGDVHGFGSVIPAPAGVRELCAYGINDGQGRNQLLGCRDVRVMTGDPIGGLERGSRSTVDTALVTGWVLDPDSPGSARVHIYRDGAMYAEVLADQGRFDVAAKYPGYDDARGFTTSVPLNGATTEICAFGINIGPGRNSALGCVAISR